MLTPHFERLDDRYEALVNSNFIISLLWTILLTSSVPGFPKPIQKVTHNLAAQSGGTVPATLVKIWFQNQFTLCPYSVHHGRLLFSRFSLNCNPHPIGNFPRRSYRTTFLYPLNPLNLPRMKAFSLHRSLNKIKINRVLKNKTRRFILDVLKCLENLHAISNVM